MNIKRMIFRMIAGVAILGMTRLCNPQKALAAQAAGAEGAVVYSDSFVDFNAKSLGKCGHLVFVLVDGVQPERHFEDVFVKPSASISGVTFWKDDKCEQALGNTSLKLEAGVVSVQLYFTQDAAKSIWTNSVPHKCWVSSTGWSNGAETVVAPPSVESTCYNPLPAHFEKFTIGFSVRNGQGTLIPHLSSVGGSAPAGIYHKEP